MVMSRKTWMFNPKKFKTSVSSPSKMRLTQMAEELVSAKLKPIYVKRPPKKIKENYIVDIYTKWQRNCFYFSATYRCPDEQPDFNLNFARMEYLQNGKYNLAYFRHTGKWWTTDRNLTAAQAFKLIQEGGIYAP